MKKLLKKLSIVFAVMLLIVTNVYTIQSEAATITTRLEYIWGKENYNFDIYDRNGNYIAPDTHAFLYVNNQLSFCIEPGILFVEGTGLYRESNSSYTKESIDTISKIIYYGYTNHPTGRSTRNYVITQHAIWQYVLRTGAQPFTYTVPTNTPLGNFNAEIDSLIAKANSHDKVASFNGKTFEVNAGESITIPDTNGTLGDASVLEASGLKVEISGNNLIVTAPESGITNASITLKKHSTIIQNSPSILTVYGDGYLGNVQDVIVIDSGNVDPVLMNLNIVVNILNEVNLKKSIASNKHLVDLSNQGYSIAGAEYGVYSDPGLTQRVGVLTTNSNGDTNTLTLEAGIYYVKETKAPKGFKLDTTVYTADLTQGNATIQSKDEPKFDPLTLLLRKVANKEGGPSLENAQFEVKYYDGQFNDVSGLTPLRTWVFKTNERGELRFTDNLKVSGDDLFKNASGIPVGLIGTYTFKEIKAPYGYTINDELFIAHVTESASDPALTVYNAPIVSEEVVVGKITLQKKDSETGEALANAKYHLLDANKNFISEHTTNENGLFTTAELELGTYYLQEVEAPEGFILDSELKEVTLSYKDQNTAVVEVHSEQVNKPIRGQIQIVKVNAQDEEVPVPNAKFEVYKLPNREVVDTLTTDENGFATTKSLRYGDYVIKEVEAPQEFYLNENEYPISIRVHDKTEVQYIKNDEVNVKLQVVKTDKDSQEPLAGVHFVVKNKATGEVVTFEYLNDNYEIVTQEELVTNDKGQAFTRGFLKYGTYVLEETSTLPGYIKGQPIEFTIDRDTDTVDLAVIGRTSIEPVTNEKTTTEISKVDIAGNEIVGAEMRLIEAESKNLEKKPQDKKFDIVKEIKKLKKSVDKFVEGAYENDCYSNTIAKLESDIYEIEKEFVLKTTHERSEK